MSISGVTATTPASILDIVSASKAKAAKAKANATSSSSTSSTSSTSGLDGTTTGTTFLNLLVKELQNQDPTSPMDSTAMVGQMISLNQLDQLISINQNLATATSTSTTSGTTTSGTTTSGTTTSGTTTSGVTGGSTGSSAEVAARNALLNSGSVSSNAQALGLSSSDPNSTLDFSALNTPYGGK